MKHLIQTKSNTTFSLIRYLSSAEAIERRHHLFTLEKKRQFEDVGRIKKIEVKYKGVPKECTLIMNKDISTPHDCAKHLSEWHADTSALALLDGSVYWDMHRPLTENCTLEINVPPGNHVFIKVFQRYNSTEPQQVNKAFWRTCSYLLGAVATRAFKDNVQVRLHSFPGPDIRSGSFIYDVGLSLPSWSPSTSELQSLGASLVSLCRRAPPLERLGVSEELAREMFTDNLYKREQIPAIARAHGTVTLYRVENHVDISQGPLINHAGQVGRVAVTAVHKIEGSESPLYRLQGVALPTGVILNHFAFRVLTERAKKLNPARSPLEPWEEPRGVAATA